jgi:RNA polymerase sigma factor (TIGR02999 family)
VSDVTQILSRIEAGDPTAAEKLLPLVYQELRRLAGAHMAREASDHTLQATALVHEAYLRLVNTECVQHWDSRRHFFAAAATAMRRILVDAARSKHALKRGSGRRVEFVDIAESTANEDLLALDEALGRLAAEDPLKAQIVELRYFVGMTGDQTAELLGISSSTVDRHWKFARAWLQTQVRGP